MNSDNNSGQTGFAILTDLGSKGMTVVVETNDPGYADAAATQFAHIHDGTCGEVGVIKSSLEPLHRLDGKPGRFGSTSQVTNTTFSDLKKGSWIINVHDVTDKTLYVSCGTIPAP
jgi:hypothetical protein